MKISRGQTFDVDVDDTLVLWDKSQYVGTTLDKITVNLSSGDNEYTPDYDTVLYVHRKNVNLLIKLAKLGYKVYVQSRSGIEWAQTIVKALKLEPYVHEIREKPMYYLDDKSADYWAQRLWREPVSGDESVKELYENC